MPKEALHHGIVRPMTHDDLDRVLGWRNHPDVRRYMYTQHEILLTEHQCWFERTLLDSKIHLLIFELDELPLGFIQFNVSPTGGIADWGFYAAPDAPKGSGRKLGNTVLNHAFNQLKFHKVCGQALDFNERSIGFHQTMGFKQEGTLCDQYFDGLRYHNVINFGLLAHDWQCSH